MPPGHARCAKDVRPDSTIIGLHGCEALGCLRQCGGTTGGCVRVLPGDRVYGFLKVST